MSHDPHGKAIGSLVDSVSDAVNIALNRSSDTDAQSYAKQLKLCERMHDNLNALDQEIRSHLQIFATAIVELKTADYVAEEMPELGRLLKQTAEEAEALSNHIRVRHKAYITSQAQQIVVEAGHHLKKG